MSSPEQSYEQLHQIFSNRKNQVLEFEIIPPAFGSLLQDGNCIGISKKTLAQAYIPARHRFFGGLVHSGDAGREVAPSRAGLGIQNGTSGERFTDDLAVATEIMLLFDCEYLTACNWRKRRIAALIGGERPASTSQEERDEYLVELLERERTLMATYLCSRLHRHTKSPTLWHHRFWIMNQIIKIQYCDSTANATTPEAARRLLEDELNVVLRAGELHPRNYYAFSYIRQLHVVLSRHLENSRGLIGDNSPPYLSVLAGWIVDRCQAWCLAEPRDISGWTFLFYLLDAAASEHTQRDAVGKVIRFALHVGWDGESLWTFIDLAARKFPVIETLQSFGLLEDDRVVSKPSSEGPLVTTSLSPQGWKSWFTRARALWEMPENQTIQ